jgi:hypothetical protein
MPLPTPADLGFAPTAAPGSEPAEASVALGAVSAAEAARIQELEAMVEAKERALADAKQKAMAYVQARRRRGGLAGVAAGQSSLGVDGATGAGTGGRNA